MLMRFVVALLLIVGLFGGGALAQAGGGAQVRGGAASVSQTDPFAALKFLEGSWTAHGTGRGDGQGAASDGAYTFRQELGGHVLARHSQTAGCKGPETFDCEHGDLLYIYQEAPGQPLRAIYFDNEGHVIHYAVSMPEPGTAVLLSEPAGGGPQFRLMYSLKAGVMSGSFAMQMPGATVWRSYLEWTGTRQ